MALWREYSRFFQLGLQRVKEIGATELVVLGWSWELSSQQGLELTMSHGYPLAFAQLFALGVLPRSVLTRLDGLRRRIKTSANAFQNAVFLG